MQESFAASTTLVDAPGGQPMWSVRTASAATGDPVGQIDQLARATVDAMRKAGLLQ
jgi:hypothetical protein